MPRALPPLMVASFITLIACIVRFEVGPDAGGAFFDGGLISGAPFWVVPGSAQFSPGGRYLSYVAMSEVSDGGGTSFRSGPLLVRDLETGVELVLKAAPLFTCFAPPPSNSCVFWEATQLVFAQNDEKVFWVTYKEPGPQADSSLGEIVALPSGERTQAATVNWLTGIMQLAPDFSWAIVGQQTYLSTGAAIGFLSPLDGVVEHVVSTCRDPSALVRDGVTDGSVVSLVLENCTVDGSVGSYSLKVYPMTMPSQPVARDPTPAVIQPSSGFVGNVFARDQTVFYTLGFSLSHHAPLTGGPSEAIGGELLSVSPDGRWVVVGAANFGAGFPRTSSVRDMSTGQVDSLGVVYFNRTLGPLPWADARTLIFADPVGGVSRWVAGRGGPVTVYSSDAGVGFRPILLRGRVGLVETRNVDLNRHGITVTDGTNTTTFMHPGLAMTAHLFTADAAFDLGIANAWTLGARYSLRGDFHFDAVGNPSPGNGFTLVATP